MQNYWTFAIVGISLVTCCWKGMDYVLVQTGRLVVLCYLSWFTKYLTFLNSQNELRYFTLFTLLYSIFLLIIFTFSARQCVCVCVIAGVKLTSSIQNLVCFVDSPADFAVSRTLLIQITLLSLRWEWLQCCHTKQCIPNSVRNGLLAAAFA